MDIRTQCAFSQAFYHMATKERHAEVINSLDYIPYPFGNSTSQRPGDELSLYARYPNNYRQI